MWKQVTNVVKAGPALRRKQLAVLFGLAFAVSLLLLVAIDQPGYTDAYYYFNAGQRVAEGDGLTDPYLWVYINAPDALPGPSHTYWMPLSSLIMSASMVVFGASFTAAQLPSLACYVGLVLLAAWLGARLGDSARHGWLAGWLVMFSGFFVPFWMTTDTFALFGLIGAGALVATGYARETQARRWYAASGVLAALAHLTRADGLLLLFVVVLVALWPSGDSSRSGSWRARWARAGWGVLAYMAVMSPWFVRNMGEIGVPLPSGGVQTIWLRGYNELVNYPPSVSAADFWDWGLSNIFQSRWEALVTNLGTFVAVETWVILAPFVLLGVWQLRRAPVMAGVVLYAVGLHVAMTFVFAYPGYRGGLFHSSSALLPFWAVSGIVGLDRAIVWAARRRRWPQAQAKRVFGGALMVLAVVLSVGAVAQRLDGWQENGAFYRTVVDTLALQPDDVLMVNDPAALYYHTGRMGVVVPNSSPEAIPEIAAKYGVTYVVVDVNRTDPFTGLFYGTDQYPFLEPVADWSYERGTPDPADDIRVYRVMRAGGGE